ncbi:MAG: hypothetical protein R3250_15480, partial [Melioribacteraceae bacterium]|nr:hypothetical protein [Melioribacteraceae bacterium]
YAYDMYNDQNLGAIILISDGLFNEGRNPLYQNLNFKAPVYTIGLGDTLRKKDLLIKNVFYNKIAYLGDKINIQLDIQAFNAAGTRSILTVYEDVNNKLQKKQEKTIRIQSEDFFTTESLTLEANNAGINRYRFALNQIANEKTIGNNIQDIYIEVLDAKQKILLLANAPHPDLAAFKEILEGNKNYEIEIVFAQDANMNVSDYDFFIFHNLPSSRHDISSILSRINNRQSPRLFIVGTQTNLQRFNSLQSTLNINGNTANTNEVQASINRTFNLFNLGEATMNGLEKYVPLVSAFGEFTPGPKTNTLLYQKIGNVETQYPLLCFSEDLGIKTAVLAGEGIWKWKLFNYLEQQNFDLIKDLIGKTTVYTTVKEDKRKFRVSSAKNLYKENENISFEGQLYNNSYQLINDPDVFITIKNNEAEEFNYTFSKRNNAYTLDAGLFPEGTYRYNAETVHEGIKMEQSGQFTVQAIQLELFNLTADHTLLNNLSNKYGDRVYRPGEIEKLQERLINSGNLKPVVYSSSSTRSVIHYKWIFALLFLLLAAEWFIRRYLGSY